MDGVMGVEARELPVRGLVRALAVLLGITLIMNQTFWGIMDGVLDSLLVPIAKTQEDVSGKVQGRVLYGKNVGMEREMDLLLDAAVIPTDTDLLLKDAVPVSAASEVALKEPPSHREDVTAVTSIMPDIVQPQVEETEHLSVEAKLPETWMPAPDEPSVIIPESLPDVSVIVEDIAQKTLQPDAIVSEDLSDVAIPVEDHADDFATKDLEKPSGIVSEQQPGAPTSTEVRVPAPIETDVTVSEKPAEEPVIPGTVVPDIEIADSEVTDDVITDVIETESGENTSVSCFLLDEAGMLYGFLPEYADITDGCLVLPAECTGIRSGAFLGCGTGIVELYIPAGAAVIEEGAFSGLDGLEWIEVEGGNPGYASESGVLFDITRSVLVKFPSGRVSIYSVPPYVTMVAGGAFEGSSLSKLNIRNCANISFSGNAFGYSSGNGIEIEVPEGQFDMYTQMLSGYVVVLEQ